MTKPSDQTSRDERFDVDWCRRQFPGLDRQVAKQPAVFFDGPAGSQVPLRVIDAVAEYLTRTNANHAGLFATSRESDAILESAHEAMADFVGTTDPSTVVFGANMTSLTLSFSRALARTWKPGDEILVTQMEHDANFTPWMLAARDVGVSVECVKMKPDDCTLDLDDLAGRLSSKTRLVAVGCSSNAVGSINPIGPIVEMAHAAGALVFLDAVHHAPHIRLNVDAWGCDFLAASAYKFFGPHVGLLWGRREQMETLTPYKVRPASNDLPDRWMNGTQNHEGIAGAAEAVAYLADLGRTLTNDPLATRRDALDAAFRWITQYERNLVTQLIAGLLETPHVRVWGITDPSRAAERVPTVSITHERLSPRELAEYLACRGLFVWHGNFYAQPLTEALGLEPDGLVRIGLLHYNTSHEVQRLLATLAELE